MNIALDARLVYAQPTGIGRTTQTLVQQLMAGGLEHSLHVLYNEKSLDYLPSITPTTHHHVPIGQASWKIQTHMPRLLRNIEADLVHYPYFIKPIADSCPSIVTIHDTIFSVFPHYLSLPKRMAYEALTRLAIRSSSRILTISESTKRDLVRFFGAKEEQIAVIPWGVDTIFRCHEPANIAGVLGRYGIAGPYLFYVGNHKPHKNLLRLLGAFSQISPRVEHELVIGGARDPRYTPVLERFVTERGLEGRVRFCGPIADDDLPFLYGGAQLFLFPSLYEGFGLPPLEAMACGAPVLTSRVSSLPEVVGTAAIQVDPTSVPDIAAGILEVLTNSDTAVRLRGAGIERAAMFSWETTANRMVALYEEVLACS